MFDEKFIEEFMPSLNTLAKKYANEEHDEDELLSDGQMAMLEYLSNTDRLKNKNLKRNLYHSLYLKLKRASAKHEDEKVNIELVSSMDIRTYESDNFIDAIKECLSKREFDILTSYYGIFTYRKTSIAIAKENHITSQGVLWIIHTSKDKIRKSFEKNGIRFEDLF